MQLKGWGRRGLSTVVLALLLASTVVACGSEDSSSSSAGGRGSSTTSTTFPKLLDDVPQPIITIAYLLHDELTDQGYDIGEIDDGFVARVEKAVEEFQRDHDLPETGALDQATAAAFQDAAGTDALTIVRSVQSVLTSSATTPVRSTASTGPRPS